MGWAPGAASASAFSTTDRQPVKLLPQSGRPQVAPRRGANQSVGLPLLSLCPAPSIDTAGGISARTCLSEASFRARRPTWRRAGKSGKRASSFGSFSSTWKKMNKQRKTLPQIGRTSLGSPPRWRVYIKTNFQTPTPGDTNSRRRGRERYSVRCKQLLMPAT